MQCYEERVLLTLPNAYASNDKCSKSAAPAWISAPNVAQKCGSKDEQSMKWQKCANPQCGFVRHSNPAVSKSYCCVMCQSERRSLWRACTAIA